MVYLKSTLAGVAGSILALILLVAVMAIMNALNRPTSGMGRNQRCGADPSFCGSAGFYPRLLFGLQKMILQTPLLELGAVGLGFVVPDPESPHGFRLFHSVSAGSCNLTILSARPAGSADGADDLSANDDGYAPVDGNCSLQCKDPQTITTGGKRVLKRLGRSLEERRGASFIDRNGRAAVLRVVHFFEIDECPVGIHDRDRHRKVVLPSFGNSSSCSLLGGITIYRNAVLLRLSGKRDTDHEK